MTDSEHQFGFEGLAAAVTRAGLRKAAGYKDAPGRRATFDGFSERDISSFVEAWLHASGFDVYGECRVPGYGGICDLYAETWRGLSAARELKLVYDTGDARFNKKRFHERREILKDAERLAKAQRIVGVRAFVVWGFAATDTLVTNRSKTFRLLDVVQEVSKIAGPCSQTSTVDLARVATTEDWARWGHVFVWTF